MNEPLHEYEGTWEEIAAQSARWTGHRVRLSLLDMPAREPEMVIPPRPQPTPEQVALGILPVAVGTGVGSDILRSAQSQRQGEPSNEGEGLWQAVAENRAVRRQLTEERE